MKEFVAAAKKIRLRQLRCFVAVARKKSFVLAAKDLGLTQPAVSRSVRELEQNLGQELFDRSTRGAELTPRGRSFLAATESGLMQIFQGVQSATGEDLSDEIVRIGALPNVCSRFLPAIVKSFKDEFPSVKVRVIPGTNSDLLDSLRRGDTDFVIGRLSTSEDMRGLNFQALFDEPLVFVVRAGHPLSAGRATLQEILSYPMLLLPEDTIIRQEVSRYLSGQGVSALTDTVETTSSDFQRAYIMQTDCVAVIPRGVIQAELDSGAIVQMNIGKDAMKGPVGLTTNPDLRLGAGAQILARRIITAPQYAKTGIQYG
ncbi:MAG: LysR family transcriptional regulator [Octadecabacter sp.]|nr:LysR family transcriptional regulator [Octadecabacter sp.]